MFDDFSTNYDVNICELLYINEVCYISAFFTLVIPIRNK